MHHTPLNPTVPLHGAPLWCPCSARVSGQPARLYVTVDTTHSLLCTVLALPSLPAAFVAPPASRTFFGPTNTASSGAQSDAERLDRERVEREHLERQLGLERGGLEPPLEQEQTLQVMATLARAAADEATTNLAAHVEQLRLTLERLPGLVAREIPALVREHDESEAERLAADANESLLEKQIGAAATCAEIGKIEGFTYNSSMNTLTCNDCQRYASSKHAPGLLRRGARDAGVFKGVDPTMVPVVGRKAQRHRRPMAVIRSELRHHVRQGSLHEWCVMFADEQRKETRKAISIGLTCAMLVYEGIKEHDSYRSFERRIAVQHRIGTSVGSKNHSREFARKFTNAIYDTTIDCIATAITQCDPATSSPLAPNGRPPPLAVLADKATVLRRTGQMHGLITFLEGALRAIFVSVLLVTNGTGAGLAILQIRTYTEGKPLRLTYAAVRIQMTGGAYDGQYQGSEQGIATGLDVSRHFCHRLCLNPGWHLSRWDRAHLIELAMKDTRELKNSPTKSIKFYVNLSIEIADANSTYLYGKGFERIKLGHAKLKQRMHSVGSVCTTRFCHSERKVYKAFAGNYVVIVTDMETERINETGIKARILKIKTITFVVHLFGTIDLLRPLKNLSLAMQAVNVLPWEQDNLISVFLTDIELLEGDLRARKLDRRLATVDSNNEQHIAFEYLVRHERQIKQGIVEMKDKKTGEGLQIKLAESSELRASRRQRNFTDATEEFESALDDLADLARAIHNNVNARLMNTDAEERWIRRMRVALDLRIMAYPDGTMGRCVIAELITEASYFVAIDRVRLAVGDRIAVLVQAEPPIWWPASIGGSVAGAGVYGVRIVYDAFPAQGYHSPTASRVAFQALMHGTTPDGSQLPSFLYDAEENAWWPWRRMPRAETPMEAETDAALTSAPTESAPRAAFDCLLLLLQWMNSRFDDAPEPAMPGLDPMPIISELWRQRCKLERRLQMFANSAPYQKLWEGQSGTAIMRTIFTEPRFYEGCGDFLHLFKHMAAKTANEAVVEGMGAFWDDAAGPKRHLDFETGVKEAVICYSGPPTFSAEATPFLTRALNTYFEGGPEKWNFTHEDQRFRGIVFVGGSKVLDKLSKVKPRLPSTIYGHSQ